MLLVVSYHAGLPIPGGFVGVDVFFVISGFVITTMLQREFTKQGRIRFGRFYLRRLKRLMPALALTVAMTVVVSTFVLSPLGTQQATAATGIGAMLMAGNLVIARISGGYFDAPAETNALLHTWSLSVEEQFYLAFPLILASGWTLARGRGRRLAAPVLVGLIGSVSFLLAVVGSSGSQPPLPPRLVYLGSLVLGFYSPLTRAWEFAAGALLALLIWRWHSRSAGRGLVVGGLGTALLVAAVVTISSETPFPGAWTLLPVVATVLLIGAGSGESHAITRVLSSTPMARLGDWSYSIYLWHWPFIVFAKAIWPDSQVAVLGLALFSLLPAVASYYWLEQPLRTIDTSKRVRLAGVLGGTLVTPIVLSLALGLAAQRGFWVEKVQHYQAAIQKDHAGQVAGCGASLPWLMLEECTWNTSAPGSPIYLVGDSHADHISEGIIEAGKRLGRPVSNFGVNGCAFTEDNRLGSVCSRIFEGGLGHLQESEPGLVIISNSVADPSLASTLSSLANAGHTLLVVQITPDFPGWRPDSCSVPTIVNDECKSTQTTEAVLERQRAARQVTSSAARDGGASVVDILPNLCPDGTCATEGAGLIRFRDSDHLTVAQSRALAPVFERAIDATDGDG